MSDEAALLNAIIAHPGEDTPRLAYADWLEENDAPIQADFIRTQCRLASCSAADPDYPDLLERFAELVAQFGPIAKMTAPEFPPEFAFHDNLALGAENFRRGFPYTIGAARPDTGDVESEQFCAGLPKLLATTTIRQLRLIDLRNEAIIRALTAPGAEGLTGLASGANEWLDGGSSAILQALAASKALPTLERLFLYMQAPVTALAPLAAAKLDRLVHLELPILTGLVRDLRVVTEAKWFRALRSVRAGGSDRPLESALLAAFAKMPHLEALDLRFHNDTALKALGSPRAFPSLARLEFLSPLGQEGFAQLARGTFPRLAELVLYNVRSYHLAGLLNARWFPRLRVLALRYGMLSDRSVVALSKSPAAANLRNLQIENVPLGPSAFAALGDGARFPNLTTLALNTTDGRKMKGADMVRFAKALNLPRLRHLDLSGWPLGEAGAKALAANPALAALTRLVLSGCAIGEKGLTAIARSRHLQQLIELDVTNNKLKTASALRNPARLPRLATARLGYNALTKATFDRLTAARALVVRP